MLLGCALGDKSDDDCDPAAAPSVGTRITDGTSEYAVVRDLDFSEITPLTDAQAAQMREAFPELEALYGAAAAAKMVEEQKQQHQVEE